MRGHRRRWLTITAVLGVVAGLGAGLRGGRADDPKRPTAEEVVEAWKPTLPGVTDLQTFSAAPKEAPGVAACTFRAVGPSFEAFWNHYADRCGAPDRYEPKRFLVAGTAGPKGVYIISDRMGNDGQAGRGLSLFVLRTEHATATVTIRPDADGKAVLGSIAVALP